MDMIFNTSQISKTFGIPSSFNATGASGKALGTVSEHFTAIANTIGSLGLPQDLVAVRLQALYNEYVSVAGLVGVWGKAGNA